MKSGYRLVLSITATALLAASVAAAQDKPEQKNAIEELQARSVLTDEDRAALNAWVQQRYRPWPRPRRARPCQA